MSKKHTVSARDAKVAEPLFRFLDAIGERIAPEIFKCLGWSVAIAAVWILAYQVDSLPLTIVGWALCLLVLARLQWALNIWKGPTKEPDGTLTLHLAPKWLVGLTSILAFLALAVVIGVAWSIRSVEVLKLEVPSAPALHGEGITPDDPRAERSGQGAEGRDRMPGAPQQRSR